VVRVAQAEAVKAVASVQPVVDPQLLAWPTLAAGEEVAVATTLVAIYLARLVALV